MQILVLILGGIDHGPKPLLLGTANRREFALDSDGHFAARTLRYPPRVRTSGRMRCLVPTEGWLALSEREPFLPTTLRELAVNRQVSH